jgi:hypothetical protein
MRSSVPSEWNRTLARPRLVTMMSFGCRAIESMACCDWPCRITETLPRDASRIATSPAVVAAAAAAVDSPTDDSNAIVVRTQTLLACPFIHPPVTYADATGVAGLADRCERALEPAAHLGAAGPDASAPLARMEGSDQVYSAGH